jgi:hypothetical protein
MFFLVCFLHHTGWIETVLLGSSDFAAESGYVHVQSWGMAVTSSIIDPSNFTCSCPKDSLLNLSH